MGTAPASAREALDMVRAGLGYLAAADAAQLSAATQAECLRELEQDDAVATAARASFLAGIHRRAGLRRRRRLQRGVLADAPHRDHPGRRRRAHRLGQAGRHPPASGRGAGRRAGLGVGRAADLPVDRQAARSSTGTTPTRCCSRPRRAGLGLEELASLFAEMYERSRSERPDQDPDRDFADRGVKLATTFGGAGVMHGDLDAGVRRDGRPGAGRAGRPGRRRTMTGPGTSGTTTRWPRRCAG